jgi:predicted nucleotidyltransferase
MRTWTLALRRRKSNSLASESSYSHSLSTEATNIRTTVTAEVPHREIVRLFADIVREEFADSVVEVLLYGSVAREEWTPDSDVDLLVVLSDSADTAEVEDDIRDRAYDLELEHGVAISLFVMSHAEYERRSNRLFYRTVREEGERVYG